LYSILDCKKDELGQGYRGETAVTKSGLQCQAWTSQTPHGHGQAKNAANFPEGNLADAKNFCRNPDSEPFGPWCYTTDPKKRWEYCSVNLCSGKKTCTQSFDIYHFSLPCCQQ
jgi:hypothetical protein